MHSNPNDVGVWPITRYALAVLAVAIATWLELFLVKSPAALFSLAPFDLAVAVIALIGGLGPGLTALVLSAIATDFFIIEPGSLLRFQSASQAWAWGAHLAAWLGYCLMAARIRRSTEFARTRCRDAERTTLQADRMAQLATSLAQARTPSAVMEAAVQEPLHALNADAGLLLLIRLDGGAMEVARSVGYRTDERGARLVPAFRGRTPASDAIGRGAPVLLPSRDAYASEYPEFVSGGSAGSFESLAAVPLVVGSRVVAVVQLEFRAPRHWTMEDREYLASLGARAAQALDRTFQLESALRARVEAEASSARADQELAERQKIELALRSSETRYRALAARTSRLHGLASALSEAVTLHAVAHAVVQQGRNVLGATSGEVLCLGDDRTRFHTLYSDVSSRADEGSAQQYDAEPGLCATHVVETLKPVFVASFQEWQERYHRSAALAADGGYVSSATLPLLVDGRATGALAFYFTAPVNFDDEYQALLISVAQHCEQALERARLYESAQRARAEAETANSLKDEFVSIVSHELRTPLNAMLGWTSMLQKGGLDAATAERALRSIHDNATRQARLVEELLDLSRLTSGRLALDVDDVDLRALLRGVVDSMIPAAAGAGLELELSTIPAVTLRGDVRRLEQVFFNLLGNAVKFTPRGGRITIDARIVDGAAEVRVSDTGAGIDASFLPHMFERFRQGDNTSGRRYGGVGLGLSIAKELVDAHHGRIFAESAGSGRGSTFVVTLPAVPLPGEEPFLAAEVSFPAPARTVH
jgi:signal transduction histidine kinase